LILVVQLLFIADDPIKRISPDFIFTFVKRVPLTISNRLPISKFFHVEISTEDFDALASLR